MKVLLVHPEFPTTYWGFQYALPHAGKRASLPPLGLLTMAALLPRTWVLRLIDRNCRALRDADLEWADVVLTGGMRVQLPSMHDVIRRCRALGRRVVVGGPAPTTSPDELAGADAIFCGEAEGRSAQLIAAIRGELPPHAILRGDGPPDLATCPVPRYDLLEVEHYASMSIQYSRGCPYRCEFCDVIEIFGRRPRVKSPEQIIAELDALHDTGYRGSVFFVDDNFIGNRKHVREALVTIARWQRAHGHPFELYTEASINLAADDALIADMRAAGFGAVFVGIETPSTAALQAAGKAHNLRVDLRAAIDTLARRGLEVMGGFIVGFDQDGADACEAQRLFLDDAPVPLAMIGLLTALPGTALWRRLEGEGRLRRTATGDQFGRPNFEPALDEEQLLSGYLELLCAIYSPEAYFRRCRAHLERAERPPVTPRLGRGRLRALLRTSLALGVARSWRREYWRLVACALPRGRHALAWAVAHAAMGDHMIRYTARDVAPRIEAALAEVRRERARDAARRRAAPAPRAPVHLPVLEAS